MRNIQEMFNSAFYGQTAIFNPLAPNSRYKDVIYDYKSFGNLKDTADYFKLSEKQVKILLGLNGNMPEIYLATIMDTDVLNLQLANHTVQDKQYKLEDFILIPKKDYKNILDIANNQNSQQVSFSQLLYEITKDLKVRNVNYQINYRVLSLLMTPEIMHLKAQAVLESCIPTIYYHIYKTTNDILEITRIYDKSLKVYQQFKFRIGDFEINNL